MPQESLRHPSGRKQNCVEKGDCGQRRAEAFVKAQRAFLG